MNFSYHPKLAEEAKKIRVLIDDLGLTANFIVGGDGSLLVYLPNFYDNTSLPTFLISSNKSFGFYSSCRLDNYRDFLTNYAKSENKTLFEKEYYTLSVSINNKILKEFSLNEVIISPNLEHILDCNLEFQETGEKLVKMRIKSTGFMFYTANGWSGYASNCDAIKVKNNNIGAFCIFEMKENGVKKIRNNSFETEHEIKMEILNHHKPMPHLSVDCKDLYEYDKSTTNKKHIFTKPHRLKTGDIIAIKQGKPIIIIRDI
ncbi:Uncharacterised protein [Candidatus Tiddalikarchaeum anstoanum]|nr:Uncharacterised protein [Candidatus Tiddalikarchaeum anstoanum]